MQIHEDYGKRVLKIAIPEFDANSEKCTFFLGNNGSARIDGIIGQSIAVEIESRVNKQIRGALLDLIMHPFRNKLLVILPVHMNNPSTTENQCKYILKKFLPEDSFQIALLSGYSNNEKIDEDVKIIKSAVGKFIEFE